VRWQDTQARLAVTQDQAKEGTAQDREPAILERILVALQRGNIGGAICTYCRALRNEEMRANQVETQQGAVLLFEVYVNLVSRRRELSTLVSALLSHRDVGFQRLALEYMAAIASQPGQGSRFEGQVVTLASQKLASPDVDTRIAAAEALLAMDESVLRPYAGKVSSLLVTAIKAALDQGPVEGIYLELAGLEAESHVALICHLRLCSRRIKHVLRRCERAVQSWSSWRSLEPMVMCALVSSGDMPWKCLTEMLLKEWTYGPRSGHMKCFYKVLLRCAPSTSAAMVVYTRRPHCRQYILAAARICGSVPQVRALLEAGLNDEEDDAQLAAATTVLLRVTQGAIRAQAMERLLGLLNTEGPMQSRAFSRYNCWVPRPHSRATRSRGSSIPRNEDDTFARRH